MEFFFSEELVCSSCYVGFNFINNVFFNNGIKFDYSVDLGVYRVSIDLLDIGKFWVLIF